MTYLGNWATYYIYTNTNGNFYEGDGKANHKLYYEYEPSNGRYRVNVECYLVRPKTDCGNAGIIGTITPNVNGSSNGSLSFNKARIANATGTRTDLIGTKTFYVYPNTTTGKSSVSFSSKLYAKINDAGWWWMDNYVTRTCSHTWSLPTVAVSSSITNNTSSSSRINFGSDVTFTITSPAGSSVTHTLTYSVGGTTYTIASASSLMSIPYTFPTNKISSFPNTATPEITVTCTSSNGTTSNTTVYLQVPNTYQPSISQNDITITEGMTGKDPSLNNLWIKLRSKLHIVVDTSSSGQESATITGYKAEITGFSPIENHNLTNQTIDFTTGELASSGTVNVKITIYDSRGFSNNATKQITVLDYFVPTIVSANVERCDGGGTLDDEGTYGKITVSYKIAPLNSGGVNKNSKTLTVQKELNGTVNSVTNIENKGYTDTVTQVFPFSLTSTSTNTFYFKLKDIFNVDTIYPFQLGVVFKLISKRAGGKGIAFGKVATQDGFDCNMNAIFRGTLTGTLTGSATSAGTATTATKLGSSTVGSTSTPIYLNAGSPSQCTDLAITTGKTTVGNITWDWIKLGNGYAVCFGRRQVSTTINTTWGNLKTSANISLDNYPFTFTELPTITYAITTGDSGSAFPMNVSSIIPTTSNPGGISLVRGSALTTTQKFIINITAWGKWK